MSRASNLRVAAVCALGAAFAHAQSLPNPVLFPNGAGLMETRSTESGPIDLTGPFFKSLGTNGRSCASCHVPAESWSISADGVAARFQATRGLDPIFRTNDGSNCDHDVNTSTRDGRRNAFSLLISRGLIRIAIPVPANAEFEVVGVVNPYGCNETSVLSLYRRPLPATNLRFLSAVMWDGRGSSAETNTSKILFATNPGDLLSDLAHQALDATAGHAQGSIPLTHDQQQAIVDFEMRLVTAQAFDYRAGSLSGGYATGGAATIAASTMPGFYIGINDPLGGNPFGIPFTPVIFTLFDSWAGGRGGDGDRNGRRAAIARGEALFNSKRIHITGVGGLNDDLNVAVMPGTCGTCHDSPGIGNHSVSAPLDIGVADVDGPLEVSYLPVITLQNKTTRELTRTTDPGRALITGRWKDIGRLKGPILRGLSGRAPYFHNGSARTLGDVLEFYDRRFHVGFTQQEKNDLLVFLSAL